jgi:hypothetical protein
VVAKENDDDVFGNLLLHAFVFLNEDEKNTGLLEEEEEEEKVLALLFIVVVAIRPRSACLIMLISS